MQYGKGTAVLRPHQHPMILCCTPYFHGPPLKQPKNVQKKWFEKQLCNSAFQRVNHKHRLLYENVSIKSSPSLKISSS